MDAHDGKYISTQELIEWIKQEYMKVLSHEHQ